jgi:hypothetical protein
MSKHTEANPLIDELIVALREAKTALAMLAITYQTNAADRVMANLARVIDKAEAQS